MRSRQEVEDRPDKRKLGQAQRPKLGTRSPWAKPHARRVFLGYVVASSRALYSSPRAFASLETTDTNTSNDTHPPPSVDTPFSHFHIPPGSFYSSSPNQGKNGPRSKDIRILAWLGSLGLARPWLGSTLAVLALVLSRLGWARACLVSTLAGSRLLVSLFFVSRLFV